MNAEEAYLKKVEKVKFLFEQGQIKQFKELFDIIPYSILCKKINTNNVRFKAKIEDPISFKLVELRQIARELNIDPLALVTMVLQDPPSINEEV